MMKDNGIISQAHIPLQILLADDDLDDRYFFDKVLNALPILTNLTTVDDGEKLMTYLSQNLKTLPDVLFLDLNMPRKKGFECLFEIRNNNKLKKIPVVIYSTFVDRDMADLLYKGGADFYVPKTTLIELDKAVKHILHLLTENKFSQPARARFVLTTVA
jgi:CheY-like chemotaxis protein